MRGLTRSAALVHLRVTVAWHGTFRRISSLVVAVVLSCNLAADTGIQTTIEAPRTVSGNYISDQVSRIQPGTLIAIRFTDGSKARGYLTQADANGFSFRVGDSTTGDQHRTTFNAVQSVKVVHRTHTHPLAWIATGAILAAVVAVVIGFLIERHNEGG
jgi:hypothetical protein